MKQMIRSSLHRLFTPGTWAVLCFFLLLVPGSASGVIVNGDFSVSDPLSPSFGWVIEPGADVRVEDGTAILSGDGGRLAEMGQTFTIPSGTLSLVFEVISMNLLPNPPTELPPAFEVHLIDADTLTALAHGLPFADGTALFNYQQTGEIGYAANVSVEEAPASGQTWTDVPVPFVVTVEISEYTEAPVNATLSFILIGSGDDAGSVAIDNVKTVAYPVAVNDFATIMEDEPVNLRVLDNDYDPDGTLDPATVTVTVAPLYGETVVDSQTGVVTYTPDRDYNGPDQFSYTVCDNDGNLSNEAVVTLTVLPVNDPPIARAGDDQTVAEGSFVTLDGTGSSDVEGDILYFFWEQPEGPAVILSDETSPTPEFTAPDVGPGGAILRFRLTVSDREAGDPELLSSTDTCDVNVTWENQSPVADAGADQTVDAGTEVTLDGSLSYDPDPEPDGIKSYFWEQIGGPSAVLSDSAAVTPTFTAPHVGLEGSEMTFKLTVTDRGSELGGEGASGLIDTDTCTVTVNWVNRPPTARAGGDRTVNEGDVVILDGTGSTDPDDGIASYLWSVVSTSGLKDGQMAVISDPEAANTTLIAPKVIVGDGAVTIRLTVTDTELGGALFNADEFTVTILDVIIPGDVDDSGTVDLGDLIIMLRILAGLPITNVEILLSADVNGD
ncbi:MAG TPA: hypothetical protein ENN79_07855, partial [Desulfobacteraceae bacterium]|nr:hypothetical protein [Desulfobacteraceae bacterium]